MSKSRGNTTTAPLLAPLVLTCSLLTAACTGDTPAPSSSTVTAASTTSSWSTRSSRAATAPASGTPTRDSAPSQPPAAAGPNDEDGEFPTPLPAPIWDEQSREAARQAARQAMTAFARPDLAEQAWWADLAPQLTPAAAAAYAGTDPAEVPARTVTAEPVLVDETSAYLAGLDVTTDVGTYRVLLSREGQGAPWLVERLTPPSLPPVPPLPPPPPPPPEPPAPELPPEVPPAVAAPS